MRSFLLIIALGLAFPAQAAMYKWVDAQGRTHYGDALPPQAAGRANEILDKQAQTIKQNAGALSQAQRDKKSAEQARLHKELQVKTERQRRDTALLNTYTAPSEIDLARDRNLEQATLALNGSLARRAQLLARQKQLDQQAASVVAGKRPVPAHIADMRNANARELSLLEQGINQKRLEMANTRARFDADRARFIELSGMP